MPIKDAHYHQVLRTLSGPLPIPIDVSLQSALAEALEVSIVTIERCSFADGSVRSDAMRPRRYSRSLMDVLDLVYGFRVMKWDYDLYESLRQRFKCEEAVMPEGGLGGDERMLARSSLRSAALYMAYFRRLDDPETASCLERLLMAMKSERSIVLYDRDGMHRWVVMTD